MSYRKIIEVKMDTSYNQYYVRLWYTESEQENNKGNTQHPKYYMCEINTHNFPQYFVFRYLFLFLLGPNSLKI